MHRENSDHRFVVVVKSCDGAAAATRIAPEFETFDQGAMASCRALARWPPGGLRNRVYLF